MNAREKAGRILAAVFLALTANAVARAAEPTLEVTVNCAQGETIAKALTLGDERKPMLVVVQGVCSESVTVGRSDVTLRGDPLGSGVSGPDPGVATIAVTGSRVAIDGLTVTGGLYGIAAEGAEGLTVRNSTIENTGRTGVVYRYGASGLVDGCTIRSNPRDGLVVEAAHAAILNSTVTENARVGIVAYNGASARIGIDAANTPGGNTISLNGQNGVLVAFGSSAVIAMNQITGNGTVPGGTLGRIGVNLSQATADIAGGNTISGHAGQGISARAASVMVGDPALGISTANTISGNASGGVFGFLGSSLVIRDAAIRDNGGIGLALSLKSHGQLFASAIENNGGDGIRLVFGSGLFVQGNAVVSGNGGFGLQCTDGESSVVNTPLLSLSGNRLGGVSGTCTGF